MGSKEEQEGRKRIRKMGRKRGKKGGRTGIEKEEKGVESWERGKEGG